MLDFGNYIITVLSRDGDKIISYIKEITVGTVYIGNTGNKEWWANGVRHREDGPARMYANGSESWFKHGVPHRKDGPAKTKINRDNTTIYEWWIDGYQIASTGRPDLVISMGQKLNTVYSKSPEQNDS